MEKKLGKSATTGPHGYDGVKYSHTKSPLFCDKNVPMNKILIINVLQVSQDYQQIKLF